MKGIEVPFKDAGKLAPEAIYNFAKKIFSNMVRWMESICSAPAGITCR